MHALTWPPASVPSYIGVVNLLANLEPGQLAGASLSLTANQRDALLADYGRLMGSDQSARTSVCGVPIHTTN